MNRLMHVDYQEILVREPKIEYKTAEANIENRKVNIQLEKVNIEMFGEKISGISKKTIQHMEQLCDSFDKNEIFGRSRVEEVTGLKNTRASLFLKELLERNIIQKVTGYGKGKYKFLLDLPPYGSCIREIHRTVLRQQKEDDSYKKT